MLLLLVAPVAVVALLLLALWVRLLAGSPVLYRQVRTGKDGFFELWLPRNRRYTLEVRQGDWVAQGALTTFAQSPTCLTELRLSRR